jgi:hypothetical protein
MGLKRSIHGVTRWACCLAVLLAGCLEGGVRVGTLAADGATVGDRTDATGEAPGRDAEDTVAPCVPTGPLVETGVAGDDLDPWHIAVTASDAIAFSANNWEIPYATTVAVWGFSPSAGAAAPLAASSPDEVLFDGRERAMIALRTDHRQLVYRDLQREVTLTQLSQRELAVDLHGAPGRAVAHGYAAWRSCIYDEGVQHCRRSLLGGRSGGALAGLWYHDNDGAELSAPIPWVDGRGVVWAEALAPLGATGARIRSWTGGDPVTERVVDQPIGRVARVGDGFLLLDRGAWFARREGPVEPVVAGECGDFDSDGAHAVLLCQDDYPSADAPPDWDRFPRGALGALWLFDGETARRVPTTGEVLETPRIQGALFAWVERDARSDGCTTFGAGRVMAAWVTAPDVPVRVDAIGAGCRCCDGLWPEVQLAVGDGLLAWNYGGVPAATAGPARGTLGWARLTPPCP